MSRLFSTIVFSFFLLSQTISLAEEGDIERLVVPEVQEEQSAHEQSEISEDVTQEEPKIIEEHTEVVQETTQPEQVDTQTNTEEVAEETPIEEAPSEDELEAQRAEEAELREVGAGEEPAIE